jgi:hypothetical protein
MAPPPVPIRRPELPTKNSPPNADHTPPFSAHKMRLTKIPNLFQEFSMK